MFAKIPERTMHLVRWGLAIGWLVLILSLFYDPVSAQLTEPGNFFGSATATCFEFQGECLPLTPYPIGARIFWGAIVPLSIITLFVFGHEAWRRICPLSFMSQIPRALGWQRQQLVQENSWLHRNHLYLQFGLLFAGLNIRLLLVNSDRLLLGIFLLLTIFAAIAVGFLYGGKTWCNYFCPMGPVQIVYSEPSGLFGSQAHIAPPLTITQSMCRTVDPNGQEKSACVACQSPCIDIDAEQSYWSKINRPDRKLLYYGYLGLAIGFYLYFWLYSGNWNLLAGGVWNETNQLETLLGPGFYAFGRAIPIPKLVAVPLTLAVFFSTTYAIGLWLEKRYKRTNKRFKRPLPIEQIHHRLFALFTFVAFNLLFFLGVRPTLGWLPSLGEPLLSWGAVLASGFWLAKTWRRSAQSYAREREANLVRRQLNKLPLDLVQFLEGRSLEDLTPDQLYALAKVLPGFTSHPVHRRETTVPAGDLHSAGQYRLQVYEGVLREALMQRNTRKLEIQAFSQLRQELGVQESEHWSIVSKLSQDLFPNPSFSDAEQTVMLRSPQRAESQDRTIQRPRNKFNNEQ